MPSPEPRQSFFERFGACCVGAPLSEEQGIEEALWLHAREPGKEADRGNQPFLATIQSKKVELGVFTIDKPCSDTFQAVEFWRLRKVYVRDQANMELTTIDVTVPLPEMPPKGLKSVIATIPVAALFKKFDVGDELVLYVPAKVKPNADAKAPPATCEPLAKKFKKS